MKSAPSSGAAGDPWLRGLLPREAAEDEPTSGWDGYLSSADGGDEVVRWQIGQALPSLPPGVRTLRLVLRPDSFGPASVESTVAGLATLLEDRWIGCGLIHALTFDVRTYRGHTGGAAADPVLREFLRHVHARWPYWLHFLEPRPHSWGLLLHALANVPGPDYHALPAAQQEAAVEGFTGALAGMLHAAKLLHDRWGVAGNERLRLFEASRRAIRSYLKQPARGIETRVKGS